MSIAYPERDDGGAPDFFIVSHVPVPTSSDHRSRYSTPVSESSSTCDRSTRWSNCCIATFFLK